MSGSETIDDVRRQIGSQFDIVVVFLMVMAILLAVVGGLGLMGTMSINVLERTREIGVLRTIGVSNGAVLGIVIVEGVLAIVGATILAADKGALCLTLSAFDTLPDAQFAQLRPGLIAMQQHAGWLPLGMALQGVGLLVAGVLPR